MPLQRRHCDTNGEGERWAWTRARAYSPARPRVHFPYLLPPSLTRSPGILIICTDEITAYDVAAARRCIIPRVAMAYKRNLRLMQRALPPSLALSLSLSLCRSRRLVAAATPRPFLSPVRHVWVNFSTGNQPARQPACQPAASKHALGGACSWNAIIKRWKRS